VVIMHEIPASRPSGAVRGHRRRRGVHRRDARHVRHCGKAPRCGLRRRAARPRLRQPRVRVLAARASSPITEWLRALCRALHRELEARRGAIGCASRELRARADGRRVVMAPVLSQPSLPFPLTRAQREACTSPMPSWSSSSGAPGRCEGPRPALHRRPLVPEGPLRSAPSRARRRVRGDRDRLSWRNPHDISSMAHSVVTVDLVDREGHPTRRALDRVLSFFAEHLR